MNLNFQIAFTILHKCGQETSNLHNTNYIRFYCNTFNLF